MPSKHKLKSLKFAKTGGVGGDEGVHVNDTTTTSNVRLAYINPHVV